MERLSAFYQIHIFWACIMHISLSPQTVKIQSEIIDAYDNVSLNENILEALT